MRVLRAPLRRLFERAESLLDVICGPAANPAHQLGALGWFFFWIATITGIYLYIFFDSGVVRAYESVQAITETQWYAGGVMRSLHRYASDALVVVVILHVLREFAHGRFSAARAFTWVTGVPLVVLMYAAGISGYWVVWDRLAQYVAISTTEWLDVLPLFAQPVARNFLHSGMLSDRFFTLLVFIHIAAPLFMLFMMWVHIQRLSQPRVNPPRSLALGLFGTLLALSLLLPARSHAPADLDTLPMILNLDWFYLWMFPLQQALSGEILWALVAGTTGGLLLMPWLLPARHHGHAVVNLDNCNGCSRCFLDCPYGAITMAPRSDGTAYSREAVVNPSRCVDCGICVGACPTATPFRRRSAIRPGIDLEGHPLSGLLSTLRSQADALDDPDSVVVFSCEHGPGATRLPPRQVARVTLPCLGMLPPAFVDFVLSRKLAAGVVLAGCREGNCYHRLGDRWTLDRLARRRDPWLRQRVPGERVHVCLSGLAGTERLESEIAAFRQRLSRLGGESRAQDR